MSLPTTARRLFQLPSRWTSSLEDCLPPFTPCMVSDFSFLSICNVPSGGGLVVYLLALVKHMLLYFSPRLHSLRRPVRLSDTEPLNCALALPDFGCVSGIIAVESRKCFRKLVWVVRGFAAQDCVFHSSLKVVLGSTPNDLVSLLVPKFAAGATRKIGSSLAIWTWRLREVILSLPACAKYRITCLLGACTLLAVIGSCPCLLYFLSSILTPPYVHTYILTHIITSCPRLLHDLRLWSTYFRCSTISV